MKRNKTCQGKNREIYQLYSRLSPSRKCQGREKVRQAAPDSYSLSSGRSTVLEVLLDGCSFSEEEADVSAAVFSADSAGPVGFALESSSKGLSSHLADLSPLEDSVEAKLFSAVDARPALAPPFSVMRNRSEAIFVASPPPTPTPPDECAAVESAPADANVDSERERSIATCRSKSMSSPEQRQVSGQFSIRTVECHGPARWWRPC